MKKICPAIAVLFLSALNGSPRGFRKPITLLADERISISTGEATA